MVGVPAALHLAAGLLAAFAATGLAAALLDGRSRMPSAESRLRLLAALGALAYAVGAVMAGAQLGAVEVRTAVQAAGLGLIALGTTRGAAAGLALVVPAVPPTPAYAAAAAGLLAAVRVAAAGRAAALLALGLATLGAGHALEPTQPVAAEGALAGGSLLIGAWLWTASRRRILAKLLTAFAASLLALATVLAAVLSTASSAELAGDELDRLQRLADQLAGEVQRWPEEAVLAALPLALSADPLVTTPLSPQEAADLFALSFATQDFFLVLDGAGQVVSSHPPALPGAVRLALVGDPLVTGLLAGGGEDEAGGLLSSGDTVVAFGAVGLRGPDSRPEAPPAGAVVTGRLVDGLWAAQQAASLDVGLVGVVGGAAVFATEAVPVDGSQLVGGLGEAGQAELAVEGQAVFAARAALADPERGTVLGAVVTTSTPQVIAAVETQQTRRLLLVALVGGALSLLVTALVTRRFTAPITRLTDVAGSVGGGDLTRRADIDAVDEVGVLATTFDEMVDSLAEQQRDLTSSAQREARLRGRLESLTTSMGDGLIAVDAQGEVITFNPSAEALTGRAADDVLGLPLAEVLTGDLLDGGGLPDAPIGDAGAADRLGLRDPLSPATGAARLLVDRTDGSRVPVAATAAPVRAPNGDTIGRVLVLRDITADLEVEQMKTQFLANVSHELRTPITPIKGYANVLARRDVGPEATRRFAQQILDSTARLERIVAMIVDFAALDSGRVTLRREAVDLREVVADRLRAWQVDHPDRVLRCRAAGPLPPVMGDPAYLGRLLDELLDNAIKFSPDGQDVDVTADVEDDRVALRVVDRGVGIEAEAARRLFTDFVQADGTETRHFGGLGLGLGLVKRIVDGMGAVAAVDSAPGEGTTVTITLPAAGPVPHAGDAAAAAPAVPPPPSPAATVPLPPV